MEIKIFSGESPAPSSKAIVVEQGEWKMSDARPLYTQGVETCAAVAVTNPVTKVGYLGHFELFNRGVFDSFLDYVRQEDFVGQGIGDRLDIWVGGVSSISDTGPETASPELIEFFNQERSHEVEYFSERLGQLAAGQQVEKTWLGADRQFTGVELDCLANKLKAWEGPLFTSSEEKADE